MTLTAAAFRYLKNGCEPKDFAVSAVIELPADTSAQEVERSLISIVGRHEALRACYVGGTTPKYVVTAGRGPGDPECVDLRECFRKWDLLHDGLDADVDREFCENFRRLSPHEGRHVAAALVHSFSGDKILLLSVHHLAVDGISWTRLLSELDLEISGRGVDIRPPQLSCGRWVEQMRNLPPRDAETVEQWRDLASDSRLSIERRDDDIVLSGSIAGPAARNVLRTLPKQCAATPGDIMLAAFGIAIARTFGSSPTILVQGHGRYGHLFSNKFDMTGTVGWLADDYPVRVLDTAGKTDALRSAVANLPRNPEEFALCSFYCDKTAGLFRELPPPAAYFNYWGLAPRRHGRLLIPDISVNRMEVGNAGIAGIAMQVRVKPGDCGMKIEWIMNSRSGFRSASSVMSQWVAILSDGRPV